MSDPSNAPLAATLAQLDEADSYRTYSTECPPSLGWISAQAFLEEPSILDAMLDAAEQELLGNRDAAGSLVAGRLVDGFVEPVAMSLATLRRTWPLELGSVALRLHHEGWVDGVGVTSGVLNVLADDEHVGHPHANVVDDIAVLRAHLAADVVTLLTPLFAAVRARAPFGLAGMWGNAADGLVSSAVWGAFETGRDTAEAFGAADLLVDELQAREPRLRARPSALTVPTTMGDRTAVNRGTCCLWYKAAAAPEPEDYCYGCPLTAEPERVRRLAERLAAHDPG